MTKGKEFKYCLLRDGFLKFSKLHDRLNSFQSYTLHQINLLDVLLWSEDTIHSVLHKAAFCCCQKYLQGF